ncbi:MAG: hypothetical protein ACTHXA_09465 [Gulosibacter sp.]|uniref:hypothetical protein n=1 Tax=Gulosibacter sp. TaxID=2817531 RepID=UPI003F930A8E
MKRRAIPVAAAVLLLAGCVPAADEDPVEGEEISTPAEAVVNDDQDTSEPDSDTGIGEIASVEELRDAYIAAGFECDWQEDIAVGLAVEQGYCSEGKNNILVMYASEADTQQQLKQSQEGLADLGMIATYVVGPNWIINSDNGAAVAAALNGELVVIGDEE